MRCRQREAVGPGERLYTLVLYSSNGLVERGLNTSCDSRDLWFFARVALWYRGWQWIASVGASDHRANRIRKCIYAKCSTWLLSFSEKYKGPAASRKHDACCSINITISEWSNYDKPNKEISCLLQIWHLTDTFAISRGYAINYDSFIFPINLLGQSGKCWGIKATFFLYQHTVLSLFILCQRLVLLQWSWVYYPVVEFVSTHLTRPLPVVNPN